MTAHTPGPWTIEYGAIVAHVPGCPRTDNPRKGNGHCECPEVVDPGGYNDGSFGGIPNDADARLIAAAPEMFEALRAARVALLADGIAARENPDDPRIAPAAVVLNLVTDAILKAKGES